MEGTESFPQENHSAEIPAPVQGVHNHKLTCTCSKCVATRLARAKGLPTRAQQRAMREQQRQAKLDSKVVNEKVIEAAMTLQLKQGKIPDVKETVKSAGVDIGSAEGKELVSNAKELIEIALKRAGITREEMAKVAAMGLNAEVVKTASFEGQITDERAYADWSNRHKFWHDLAVILGYIAPDDGAQTTGGLVILNSAVQVATGHKPWCNCSECSVGWQAIARDALKQQSRREISANIVDVPDTITND